MEEFLVNFELLIRETLKSAHMKKKVELHLIKTELHTIIALALFFF